MISVLRNLSMSVCVSTGMLLGAFSVSAQTTGLHSTTAGFTNLSGQSLNQSISNEVLESFIISEKAHSETIAFSYNGHTGTNAQYMNAETPREGSRSFMRMVSETPGLAFLSSALVPGLGQAANQQWWKTALFAGVEIGALYLMFDYKTDGDRKQHQYNQYADDHWSVVQYAQAVVQYTQIDASMADVLTEAGLQELMNNGFIRPTFNNEIDWAMIDLAALNKLEFQTLYRSTGRPFSHVVEAYGSQQYYELPSKYTQFSPGWRDWNRDLSLIHGVVNDMPASWQYHTALEEEFNDLLRYSRNMGMLLIANHVMAGFDAYFTSKLRLHRRTLETSASVLPDGSPAVQLSYKF